MSKYVIVQNGAFIRRIGDENIRWSPIRYTPVRELTTQEKIDFGVFDFIEVAKPDYDPLTQNCIDIDTQLINGQWTQVWAVRDATKEEKIFRGTLAAESALEVGLNSGFTYNSILWHCDPTFQSQIQGFVLAYITGVIPNNYISSIRGKDNQIHELNRTQIITLAAQLMQHVQTLYAASWAAKDALTK